MVDSPERKDEEVGGPTTSGQRLPDVTETIIESVREAHTALTRPAEAQEGDPSIVELVEACREVLDDDACAAILEEPDYSAALDLAFSALFNAGIEDPENFLIQKGILELPGA